MAEAETTRRRKPAEIKIGHAYRLAMCGVRGETVVLVTKIERTTKTTRDVHVEPMVGPLGWVCDSYSSFLRRVWCEESRMIQ